MSYSPCPVLSRRFLENNAHSNRLTVSKCDIVYKWIHEIEAKIVCILESSLDRGEFCDDYSQKHVKRLILRQRRLYNYLEKARNANKSNLYKQY